MPRKKPKRTKPAATSAALPPSPASAAPAGTNASAAKKPFKYESEHAKPPTKPLTMREEEVIEKVAKGKENLEIALDLGTGERNIEKHMKNIREKIGAKTRTAVVAWWYERKMEQMELRFREGK
jgi:DNA-binding NarL/FixJ family response regulator